MSCSWFLLKPQHEIVKEIHVLGDIVVEIEEEGISVKLDSDAFDVNIDTDESTVEVDSNQSDVCVEECDDICVTLEND